MAIENLIFDGNSLRLQLVNQLAALPAPWTEALEIDLRVKGLEGDKQYDLILNDHPPRRLSGKELASVRGQVQASC